MRERNVFRGKPVLAHEQPPNGRRCTDRIRQELPATKITGAVVEFGTGDAFNGFRADRLDRWLRFEGRFDPQYDRYREDYNNAVCPVDLSWRLLILSVGPNLID